MTVEILGSDEDFKIDPKREDEINKEFLRLLALDRFMRLDNPVPETVSEKRTRRRERGLFIASLSAEERHLYLDGPE